MRALNYQSEERIHFNGRSVFVIASEAKQSQIFQSTETFEIASSPSAPRNDTLSAASKLMRTVYYCKQFGIFA